MSLSCHFHLKKWTPQKKKKKKNLVMRSSKRLESYAVWYQSTYLEIWFPKAVDCAVTRRPLCPEKIVRRLDLAICRLCFVGTFWKCAKWKSWYNHLIIAHCISQQDWFFRVLTRILKIGVKLQPSRKSWSFAILSFWDFGKKWSWEYITPNLELMRSLFLSW